MPTYYVRPDGNDLNVGTAPTNAAGTGAFRTVNKALSVAVGGDTVWIAPGTYRENVLPTIATQSTYINVYGDVNINQVAWGSGLTAGVVRITNNLVNDVGTPSGYVLDLRGKRFYRFEDIRFEGPFYVQGWAIAGQLLEGGGHRFTSCAFIGRQQQCFISNSSANVGTADIQFNKCIFHETPIAISTHQGGSHDRLLRFHSCLFTVCASPLYNGFISTFQYIGSPEGDYFHQWVNCTFVGGNSQPLYVMYSNVNGRHFCVLNCLFLTSGITATLGGTQSYSITENYNYGYNLTRAAISAGANSVTLQYTPVDTGEGYQFNFAQYIPQTPLPGSQILGAGVVSANMGGALVVAPTTDFTGNSWNQVNNPTIGYVDSRVVATVSGTGGYVPLDRSIQTVTVTAGETGKSVHVYLGSTGVTFQTPNLTCYYARNNGTSVNIPLVAGNASTWVSGSLYEVSAVTMPGVYKFDIPNAVIESGATTASIMLRGANAFNGAFVNINIEQPAQSAYLSTNGYKLLSEYAGSDGVLTVNKRTVTTVKCQITDTNGSAVAVGSSTMTVEVYSATNVLLASYTPTVQYGGNGQLTFVLDTQITGTAGTYNAYAIRTAATTDRAVFGPLQIKVNEL